MGLVYSRPEPPHGVRFAPGPTHVRPEAGLVCADRDAREAQHVVDYVERGPEDGHACEAVEAPEERALRPERPGGDIPANEREEWVEALIGLRYVYYEQVPENLADSTFVEGSARVAWKWRQVMHLERRGESISEEKKSVVFRKSSVRT